MWTFHGICSHSNQWEKTCCFHGSIIYSHGNNAFASMEVKFASMKVFLLLWEHDIFHGSWDQGDYGGLPVVPAEG